MNLKKKLTESDLQRIKAAVKVAEDRISGEVVPVIVERSGQYRIAHYKAALIAAALTFLTIIVLDRYVFTDATNAIFYDPVFIFFLVTVGGILGAAAAAYSDWLKRMLINRAYLDNATRQRAENAFLEEEVFNTRQRTGIMVFISLFEHEVIVMADRGISKVVDQKQWDAIVSDIIAEIRKGRLIDGLEAGIRECGEVLLANGFHKTDDDVNELRDDLRVD